MSKIRVRDLDRLLPDIDALRPLRRELVRTSVPDPADRWSRSGELATAADRLVDVSALEERVSRALATGKRHMEELNVVAGRALEHAGSGDPAGAVHAFLEAVAMEARKEHHASAVAFARAAHGQAVLSRDPALEALVLRRLGRAHKALGELDDALRRYGEAWEIARATPDARASAEAAIGAGNTMEQAGRWAEAERWYREALEVLAAEQGPVPERWHVALNLHIVQRSVGQVEASVSWLERAETEARGIGDETAEILFDNARGQLLMAEGHPQTATDRFRSALERDPPPFAAVTIRGNLSETLLARSLLLDASEEARAAEAHAIAHDVTVTLPHVYRTLGRCAAAMGNEDAFVLFERALEFPGPAGAGGLETAMTLQAYAETEARFRRIERALDLLAEAGRIYLGLGVEQFRRRHVDCFDAGPIHSTSPREFLSRRIESIS